MTTLNTIIEEEKKEFEEKIDTICKQADQYQINAGYPVSTPAKTIILSLFTTAMQRAYEAGRESATHKTHKHEWFETTLMQGDVDRKSYACNCGQWKIDNIGKGVSVHIDHINKDKK